MRETDTKYRVLYVEDDESILRAAARVFEHWGIELRTATDAAEALRQLREPRDRTDVIVADHNLPGALTGVDLVRAARSETGKQIPAIVTTGNIGPIPVRGAEELNCPLLYKPVDPIELRRLILRLAAPHEIKN